MEYNFSVKILFAACAKKFRISATDFFKPGSVDALDGFVPGAAAGAVNKILAFQHEYSP